MSLLSERLSPQKPPEERPLHLFVACYLVSWAGLVIAWLYVRGARRRAPVWWIISVAVLGRLLFLPSELIQSDDCYRYILDGQCLLAGINPFGHSPAQLQADPPGQLLADDPVEALQVISRVNNPDVPTIYPPLALAVFAAGAALTPWQVHGQRWMFMLCDLATVVLLLGLLRRYNKPTGWIVLYAWNPLVIKEISNTAHVDSVVALWICVLVAVLVPGQDGNSTDWKGLKFGRAVLAGIAAGAAVLAKLYPLLLVPCCVVFIGRGRRWIANVMVMLVAAVALVTLCYWPFLSVGTESLTAGLRTYVVHWVNNPGAFAVLGLMFDSPRPVSTAIVGLVALLAAVRLRRSTRGVDDLIQAMQITMLAWFLLAPACFPWYAVGLVAVSVIRPRSWCIVLTGSFGLFYLVRYLDYQNAGPGWQVAVGVIEHGSVWLWLAVAGSWEFFARKRSRE